MIAAEAGKPRRPQQELWVRPPGGCQAPGRDPDRVFATAPAACLDRIRLSEQDRARAQRRKSLFQYLAVHRMAQTNHFAAAIGLHRDQAATLKVFERGKSEAWLQAR